MQSSMHQITDIKITQTDTPTFSTINVTITSAEGEKLELVCFPDHAGSEERHHIKLETSVTSNSGE